MAAPKTTLLPVPTPPTPDSRVPRPMAYHNQSRHGDAAPSAAALADLSFVANPQPMLVMDQSGMVRAANPAAADLLQRRLELLAGAPLAELCAPEMAAELLGWLLADGAAKRLLQPRQSGGLPWLLQRSLWQGQQRLISIITSDDLSEREMELLRAKHQADADNAAKSAYLAGLAHELRTPLNAIIGFAEIMEQQLLGPLGNLNYVDYCQDIHGSAQHLLDVINTVLDFSKIEAGAGTLHEEVVDVAASIKSCVKFLQPLADEKKLLLNYRLAPNLPLLYADAVKLRQILINLLSNAIKFTPHGGAITISASDNPQQGIAISVSDSGCGMNESEIQEALRPYGQVGHQRQGTGLGLPLSKALAAMHGAELHIISQPRLGTTVTVRFPLARSKLV